MKLSRLLSTASIITAVAATANSTAWAQSSGAVLDEIIVTSQVRQESLQDVPVSVVAVSGDFLRETNVARLEDLQASVPNFNMNQTGISTQIYIRGIGSGINQGFEQSVGTYIDGIHYPRGQSTRSPFLDLERVEVLRGPQSILFGKNSVAGALNITTAKPTDYMTGYVLGTYEFNENDYSVEGAVGGPISDRIRGRIAGRYHQGDGYMENLTLNREEMQNDDVTLRGQLEVDVTEDITARFKAEYSEFDNIGRYIEITGEQPAQAGPFAGLTYSQILRNAFGQDVSVLNTEQDNRRSSNGDFSFNQNEAYQMSIDWALGDFTLQSNTAYTAMAYQEQCDCDFTGANIFFARLDESYDQLSQEFRLISPAGERLDYIVGAYFQTSDHEYLDNIEVPTSSILIPAVNGRSPGAGNLIAGTGAGRVVEVDSDVWSVFGQLNFDITDQFAIQLGARYTDDSKSGSRLGRVLSLDGSALPAAQVGAPLVYANLFGITTDNLSGLGPQGAFFQNSLGVSPVSDEINETAFTPEVKIEWKPTDDALIYASYVKGNKAGGFDFRANNKNQSATLLESFTFEPEEANSYEIGTKLDLADGRATLNATGFFNEFSNLQVAIFDGILGFNVGNAAGSESKGIEIDGRIALDENLTLNGAIAFIDFEFTDYKNGQCNFGQAPTTPGTPFCDYTGFTQTNLSDVTAFVGANYEVPFVDVVDVSLFGGVSYASSYFANSTYDPDLVQGEHAKVDLRLNIASKNDDWSLAFIGKNLTDVQLLTYGGDAPLSGGTFGVESKYSFWGQGRTMAVQLGYKF
ncbi:TonB-dependent receptor [Litorimonas sp. RW-G-Af-16]|uniref:TonB-dependent receptor n=1 Tax=Litorimonas sp. RW-G-Af-16 TaxID=3241168 RepID=UPI00390CC94A